MGHAEELEDDKENEDSDLRIAGGKVSWKFMEKRRSQSPSRSRSREGTPKPRRRQRTRSRSRKHGSYVQDENEDGGDDDGAVV